MTIKTIVIAFSWLAFFPPEASAAADSGPVLYTCDADYYRDYGSAQAAGFERLAAAGHSARLEIIRAWPRAATVIARVQFSYDEPGVGRRSVRRPVPFVALSNRSALPAGFRPATNTLPDDLHGIFGAEFVTLYAIPADEDFTSTEFVETISFPREFASGNLPPQFTIYVKLTQEGSGPKGTTKQVVWSKLYRASCLTFPLSSQEYNARKFTAASQLGEDTPSSPLHREALLFPNLQAALLVHALYSVGEAYLAGVTPPVAAGSVLAAGVALPLARLAIARLARNPAVASYFVPAPAEGSLRLDVAATGLSTAEARDFLAAAPARQRELCAGEPLYGPFCASLSALDYELAYAEGRAL